MTKLTELLHRMGRVKIGIIDSIKESAKFDSLLGEPTEMISFEKRCSEIYDSLTNMEIGLKLDKVQPKEVAARLPVANQMVSFMESALAGMIAAQMNAQAAVDSYFEEKNAPNY